MTAPSERVAEAARVLREKAGKATPGPWLAVLNDRYGFINTDADLLDLRLSEDDSFDDEDGENTVSLVMGDSLPKGDGTRLPGTYRVGDVLIQHELVNDPESDQRVAANVAWIALADPSVGLLWADLLDPLAAQLRAVEMQWGLALPQAQAAQRVQGHIDTHPTLREAVALSDALLAKGGEKR